MKTQNFGDSVHYGLLVLVLIFTYVINMKLELMGLFSHALFVLVIIFVFEYFRFKKRNID